MASRLSNLEGGRIGIAAQSVGMARAALEAAMSLTPRTASASASRSSTTKPSDTALADMATEIEAARLMYLNAARLREAGEPCLKGSIHGQAVRVRNGRACVCSGAMQTLGGYGYVEDFPVERIYRDVRVCQIYEGTSDVQRMVIARAVGSI